MRVLATTNNTTKGTNTVVRKGACYCRVDTKKEQALLFQHVEVFRQQFPEHDVFADVGLGWDYRRHGLLKLMRKVMKDEVYEVVVFHEDQLSTTGHNHVAHVFEYHEVRLKKLSE